MGDIKEYFKLRKQQIREYYNGLKEAVIMTEHEKDSFDNLIGLFGAKVKNQLKNGGFDIDKKRTI